MRHAIMDALLAGVIVLAGPGGTAGQAHEAERPMTEREAVAVLRDDLSSRDVSRAIGLAVQLGPQAGVELRDAVIEAAWAEVRREASSRAGLSRADDAGPDLLFMLFEAAEAFRDPDAIPLMIEALKYGGGVMYALADMGATAFPAVLAAVSDPAGHSSRVGCGLTALRFMVEDASLHDLQLSLVRDMVRETLSGPSDSFVVNAAVQLAFVLDDPGLRGTVQRIATDRAFAATLLREPGTDEWRIDSMQHQALDLLSGAPPLPLRRRGAEP